MRVGRTPIREALQRLSREGLITILPRKGVLVSDINPRNQLLLLEVRRELGLVVTVDGKRLDEHYEIKRFTRFGFEWTYEGDSPQQLALAILFDRLGNRERAIQLSGPFMKTVIANLDNDWKLTSEEIDAFVRGNPQAE